MMKSAEFKVEPTKDYKIIRREIVREMGRWRKDRHLGSNRQHTRYEKFIQALRRMKEAHPADAWAYIQGAQLAFRMKSLFFISR